jgi:hypothetical protein
VVAREEGLELVTREITSAKDVVVALESFQDAAGAEPATRSSGCSTVRAGERVDTRRS